MARISGRLVAFLMLVIGAAVVIPAVIVSGHAAYDHSTPNADEVVTAAPAQVDVFFKEELVREAGSYYVRVFDDQATQVSDGDGTVDDNDRTHISATVTSTLPDGRYIVRWMNTSDEDGDDAEGAFCFYVNVQPSAEQSAECAELSATPTEDPAEQTAAAGGGTATEPVATQAEATPTIAPSTDNGGDNGSNTGVIVGVIVAVAVVVVVVGGAAFYMRRPRA